MSELAELITRLEKATGPDRKLDLEIRRHVWGYRPRGGSPLYTASIDAALMLVPEGYDWSLEPDAAWVRWMGTKDVEETQGVFTACGGECTAIALCIAALKARQSSPESHSP